MSCSGLYLDFGCNMGVQPRKLLEPERYPGAPVLPLFDHVFGRPGSRTRAAVCVVCVEPNPRHAPSLRRLQQRYAAEGKAFYYFDRAIALTHQTIVMAAPARTTEPSDIQWEFRSASASAAHSGAVVEVRTIDPGWILGSWLPRAGWLAFGAAAPPTVMKLDIEGGEASVLPHLLESGLLCKHVDVLMLDSHGLAGAARENVTRAIAAIRARRSGCRTRLEFADDETYALDASESDATCPLVPYNGTRLTCLDCLMIWPSCAVCSKNGVGMACDCLPPCALSSPTRDDSARPPRSFYRHNTGLEWVKAMIQRMEAIRRGIQARYK